MKDKETLWHLVQSMNKTEKRQFIRHAQAEGGKIDSGYLALYRLLGQQAVPETRDSITAKTLGCNANQLAVQKHYLANRIVSGLLDHDENNSPEMRVRLLINKSELLFSRGLLKASQKQLDAAEQLARECFAYYLQLDILTRRDLFIQRYRDIAAAKKNIEKKFELLEIISNLIEYQRTTEAMYEIVLQLNEKGTEKSRQLVRKLLRDPLLRDEHRARSPIALFQMYHTLCHLSSLLQDPKLTRKFNRRNLEIFDEQPEATRNELDYYITLIFNNTVELLYYGTGDDLQYALGHWEQLPKRFGKLLTPVRRQRLAFYRLELDFRLLQHRGEFDKLPTLRPRIERLLKVNHSYTIVFRENTPFILALTYYAEGRYKQALRMLLDVFSDDSTALRRYRYLLVSWLLRLVISAKENHADTLLQFCENFRALLKREERLTGPEATALHFFVTYAECTSTAQKRSAARTAATEIHERCRKQSGWLFVYNSMFFMGWLYALRDNVSERDGVRAVVKEYATIVS